MRRRILAAAHLPESLVIRRGSKKLTLDRTQVGIIEISRNLRIADPDGLFEHDPLPVAITAGDYPVMSFQWSHPVHGCVNGLVVVSLCPPPRWLFRVPLRCPQQIRPDLQKGIMIDGGEVEHTRGARGLATVQF